jgi:hypothetical protein
MITGTLMPFASTAMRIKRKSRGNENIMSTKRMSTPSSQRP